MAVLRQLRRSLHSRMLVRWVVLCSFVSGTVGVPWGPLSISGSGESCQSNPGQSCRCNLLSQQMGTCCCARGLAAKVSQQVTVTPTRGGCCAGKSPVANLSTAKTRQQDVVCLVTPTDRVASVSTCCSTRKSGMTAPQAVVVDTETAHGAHAFVSACPCGDGPSADLFVCDDPRLLLDEPRISHVIGQNSFVAPADELCVSASVAPDVPPPKPAPCWV